jgi:uncharacterized protein (DUF302 family)
MAYYFTKRIPYPFEEAVEMLGRELSKEGFGILCDIHVHDIMKQKLHTEFRKYRILGACNPAYALRALESEDKIGTMLPCSFIVQDWGDETEISVINPVEAMQHVDNEKIKTIAAEISKILERVLAAVGA